MPDPRREDARKRLKAMPTCGWAYDEACPDDGQISAKNYVTPKQYKEIFSSLRKEHPDYGYHDDPDLLEEAQLAYMRKNAIPHPNDGWRYEKPCPVCGEYIIHFEYDICPICGWELDPVQMDDPTSGEGQTTYP